MILIARDFAGNFYKRKQWVKTREYIMNKYNWICQQCFEPAKIVHHVVHLNEHNINNPSIAYGEDNLIPLCANCHAKIHGNFTGELTGEGLAFDAKGNLISVDER